MGRGQHRGYHRIRSMPVILMAMMMTYIMAIMVLVIMVKTVAMMTMSMMKHLAMVWFESMQSCFCYLETI